MSFPVVGLGTFQARQGSYGFPLEKGVEIMKNALAVGYRHFDTALLYGMEESVGLAVKGAISKGEVTRGELFISTKIWITEMEPPLVRPALEKSLKAMNLSYVDLIYIHWPFSLNKGEGAMPKKSDGTLDISDVDYVDTWKALEACVEAGLARSLGVSNFSPNQVARLLEHCTVRPLANQFECHTYLQVPDWVEYNRSVGITPVAYSPLGKAAGQGNPAVVDEAAAALNVLNDPVVQRIAKQINRTVAQVALRFLVQRGVSIIPKSASVERQRENLAVLDFELSPEQMDEMKQLDRGARMVIFQEARSALHYPF